jgi:hypothetical protein
MLLALRGLDIWKSPVKYYLPENIITYRQTQDKKALDFLYRKITVRKNSLLRTEYGRWSGKPTIFLKIALPQALFNREKTLV